MKLGMIDFMIATAVSGCFYALMRENFAAFLALFVSLNSVLFFLPLTFFLAFAFDPADAPFEFTKFPGWKLWTMGVICSIATWLLILVMKIVG